MIQAFQLSAFFLAFDLYLFDTVRALAMSFEFDLLMVVQETDWEISPARNALFSLCRPTSRCLLLNKVISSAYFNAVSNCSIAMPIFKCYPDFKLQLMCSVLAYPTRRRQG